jgi:hypothetical protein
LGVTGKITNGLLTINGLDESWATPAATINTLSGPLMLQANSLNDVDVMNGKVIFDTVGNLNINVGDINVEKGNINVKNGDVNIKKGNIKIEQGQVIGNQTFRGKVVLPAGQTSVHIDETWSTEPESLTLTPNYATQVWYEDMSTTGFTIRVATPSPTDQYVNWLAAW